MFDNAILGFFLGWFVLSLLEGKANDICPCPVCLVNRLRKSFEKVR